MDMQVIYRIQKLLALANGAGATEAEASLAMEKAHAIMSEHNLTMATIAASGKKGEEKRSKEGLDGQAMFDYQRNLMAAIAETNYCHASIVYKYTKRGAKGAGYQLIGTEANVATAKIMFEYLMQTINRLVMEEIGNDYRKRMSRYAISWCTGCASRLEERIRERHRNYLDEQKEEAERNRRTSQHPASPSHGALVVVMEDYAQKESDLNADFRNGLEPGTTERKRKEREARYENEKKEKYARAIAEGFDQKVAKAFADYFFENLQAAHDWCYPTDEMKKEQENYWRKEDKKAETRRNREFAKRDWAAHAKGAKAGSQIGLDAQINKTTFKSIK